MPSRSIRDCSRGSKPSINRCRHRTLEPDQVRLTTRVYEQFVRRGAKLNAEQKKRLSDINQELAARFADFRAKVLADENTWTVLQSEADLAGLPASSIATAKAAAEERGLRGKWAIVNTRSSVDPFLMFSTRRDLREVVWKKFKSRGDNGDASDTKATITAIVKLRAERATLLGYPSHAHWRMSDTMAADPKVAQAFMLQGVAGRGRARKQEVADMQAIADREAARHADRALGLSLLCGEGSEGEIRSRRRPS